MREGLAVVDSDTYQNYMKLPFNGQLPSYPYIDFGHPPKTKAYVRN